MLRRGQGCNTPLAKQKSQVANGGFNKPLSQDSLPPTPAITSSLDLIRQEIAIMKKLDHPNVVSLIEVLDDPTEDSLYMVLEMCKKGVVMKVGLDEPADPYDDETCRTWFRDMVLGMEYRKCVNPPRDQFKASLMGMDN